MTLGTTWVHVFEEPAPQGAVFRPETADIPLSRRPRLRFTLAAGGAATLWNTAPDDRARPQAAQWTTEDGVVVVRDAAGHERLRIVETAADRLVVKLP